MPTIRKSTSALSNAEWTAFINAINAMHGTGAAAPAYRAFVNLHVDAFDHANMNWGVHSMGGMVGTNFLAWHRRFLHSIERRLGVALPYWDWVTNPVLPPKISTPALLVSWSVTRNWNADLVPDQPDVDSVMSKSTFVAFQTTLEGGPHNSGHRAVGGTMSSASSPADPIFWMHHANIDRLWDVWQAQNPTKKPGNLTSNLLPGDASGIIFGKVRDTLDLSANGLDYRYQ